MLAHAAVTKNCPRNQAELDRKDGSWTRRKLILFTSFHWPNRELATHSWETCFPIHPLTENANIVPVWKNMFSGITRILQPWGRERETWPSIDWPEVQPLVLQVAEGVSVVVGAVKVHLHTTVVPVAVGDPVEGYHVLQWRPREVQLGVAGLHT